MNREQIGIRIDEVMRTDATVATEADFMLTHMPFKKLVNYIELNQKGHSLIREIDYVDAYRFDEESVFKDLIEKENNHELFMIIGRNGSGKSHLIRWIYYQFKKHVDDIGDDSEKIIFIPRAHNNLRDAFKSILDAGVLSSDRVQYYLNKIEGGTSSASEEELKDLLYANLKILVKHDKESELKEASKRRLVDFLEDSAVEQVYFRMDKGPINHIFNALTKNAAMISDGESFQENMFVMTPKEIQSCLRNASHQAKPDVLKFASELSRDDELRKSIVKYLNSIVGKIIDRTSSISGADVQSVFEEMRRELKDADKKLTLFIEDINVYKGIDAALIEVLIQEHKEDNGLCRLKSVVGSTDRYFDDYFNSALRDRMTRKIVILDSTLLEDKEKLIEFAARYINAIHFTKEQVNNWYEQNLEFPIWYDSHGFSKVNIDGNEFSIFPFNENAIINLFECLNSSAKSPRGFLKCVVKSVVSLWNEHQEGMIDSKHYFLSNEGISRINGFLEDNDQRAFDAKKFADSDRRALLYQIWGNRTFRENESGYLAGVSDEILSVFKVDKIGVVRTDKENVGAQNTAAIDTGLKGSKVTATVSEKEKDSSFQKRIKDIYDWQDGLIEEFVPHKDARKLISEFLLRNINWELEDIPYTFAREFVSKIQNYEIVGQTVPSNGLIRIERSKLAGQMIIALFNQDHQKKSKNAWNYEQGPEDEILAKTWLLKNKKQIVDLIRTEVFKEKQLEQLAVEARIAELVVLGIINNWESEKLVDSVVRADVENDVRPTHKSGEKWGQLITYYEKNAQTIQNVFDLAYRNTVGITKADSGNVKYVIIDYVELISRIEQAKHALASGQIKSEVKSSDDRITIVSGAASFYSKNIQECVSEMVNVCSKQRRQFESWLGDNISEVSVRKTLDKMVEYLRFILKDVGFKYPPTMIAVLEEKHSISDLVKIWNELKLISSVKDMFELAVLCGNIESKKVADYVEAFTNFEAFMKEKTIFFSSKVDSSLDSKITKIEKEICDKITECLENGKE